MKIVSKLLLLLVALLVNAAALDVQLFAQSTSNSPAAQDAADVQAKEPSTEKELDPETKKLHDKFQQNLSGTKFVGQFTVTGMESEKPREEEYTITSVKKLPKDDLWEITSRIKYGDHDVTVPMVMAVKWAGKTPVITVDQMFVPGLGTFDARVLLRKDKYAGTWAHGKVGGHLFGRIEKIEESKKQTDK